ncbi:hydrolase [Thiohalorhabdus denitrificans]|uniref:Hydroxyacylglutathione hydrolase n=1 Tax=Thiohalorhabdus denitrificans TaxID=381306 RepID=A0A0P9GJH1_9GAMM|nr:MBL fold metallo-hydrolase [Thiohalorhabdus denitrificans]KPV40241.1 hydrolase [Thiohalorhabdus denitrificans]SCX83236.1 hydroxyacylglutathione hydrolase [Thiohalorhabdus denitrificans]
MLFEQFYLPSLGHASYLIGSEETGEALALDVRRDVDTYYRYAQEHGLRIRYAADTHQHNDFLSGITELRQRGDLELLASARAELGYRAESLADGDRLSMGEVELEVLHTPGHTPEHISLLVRDSSRGEDPLMLLSGGALLVADVARPDLLGDWERTQRHAREVCQTLRDKILPLPDHVMVFPTHVAGSLCGGSIGSMLFTSLGYERRLNHILQSVEDENEFTRQCLNLEGLPTVPPYWPRMRQGNQAGPEALGVLTEPRPMGPAEVEHARDEGAYLVDCRTPEAFGGGHVPGALNIGLGNAFPTWAGTVLPKEARTVLVLDDASDLWTATWHLLRIGYPVPLGWLGGGMAAWRTSGREPEMLPQWTPRGLDEERRRNGDLVILDVRQPGEWSAGHVPGARHLSGGEINDRLEEVPEGRPVAVYCGSGFRSSVIASVLARAGRGPIFNTLGGFGGWKNAGLPVED